MKNGWQRSTRDATMALLPMPDELDRITAVTIAHYDESADAFWEGTRDHDVSQNYGALLRNLDGPGPFSILDLGCGPGRDLAYFRSLGHEAVGLDGAMRFVEMARRNTGCEVLHQDFLRLALPAARFDGVFANASIFHVPGVELPRVLRDLRQALRPRAVLFASNPRGNDGEGWHGNRYGRYHRLESWRAVVEEAGFELVEHYHGRRASRASSSPGWRRCSGGARRADGSRATRQRPRRGVRRVRGAFSRSRHQGRAGVRFGSSVRRERDQGL
jgi:SAM-dependent methyltransferase